VDIVRPGSAELSGRLGQRPGKTERLPENLPEKLSDIQADIIGKMSFDPKVTYMQLEQMTGRSKEAIRHNINKISQNIRLLSPAGRTDGLPGRGFAPDTRKRYRVHTDRAGCRAGGVLGSPTPTF